MSAELLHVLESMTSMPIMRIADQPPATWLRVEDMINQGWHFKARSVGALAGETGWLRMEFVHALLVLGVPVGRMFTLAALMGREPG